MIFTDGSQVKDYGIRQILVDKEKKVNNQIEDKDYTIKDIQKNEQEEDYTVTLID